MIFTCISCHRSFSRPTLDVKESDAILCPDCIVNRSVYNKPRESVNHPDHYGGDTQYEVIKVLEAWLTPEQFIGALLFNITKYNARSSKKNGLEDLKKAQWYQNRLVQYREKIEAAKALNSVEDRQ